jgi:hypothetical protein
MKSFDFSYVARQNIQAAQWRGDNIDEMKELLKDVLEGDEDGPFIYSSYVEPFFGEQGYYILQTEFDEFDPGMWVVVYEDGEIEGLTDEEFKFLYAKA